MAIVSSHTLNGVDGTHAAGIAVTLTRVANDGSRKVLFETVTEPGGRFMEEVAPSEVHADAIYELVLGMADYFGSFELPRPGMQVLKNVIVQFDMPDPEARYHMPFMLSPNSYSVWISSGPNG